MPEWNGLLRCLDKTAFLKSSWTCQKSGQTWLWWHDENVMFTRDQPRAFIHNFPLLIRCTKRSYSKVYVKHVLYWGQLPFCLVCGEIGLDPQIYSTNKNCPRLIVRGLGSCWLVPVGQSFIRSPMSSALFIFVSFMTQNLHIPLWLGAYCRNCFLCVFNVVWGIIFVAPDSAGRVYPLSDAGCWLLYGSHHNDFV